MLLINSMVAPSGGRHHGHLYSWDKVTYEADGVTPKLTKTVRSTFTDPQLRMQDEEELRIALTGYDQLRQNNLEDHTIAFLAGVQRETREGDNFFAFRRNFISPAIDQLLVGGTPSAGSRKYQQIYPQVYSVSRPV